MTTAEEYDWIDFQLLVPDVDAAVEFYVNRHRLFHVESLFGRGKDACAMLRYRDESTPLRLSFVADPELVATDGARIDGAREAKIGLPMKDLLLWAAEVFGDDPPFEQTPWAHFIVLRDPWGHVLLIHSR